MTTLNTTTRTKLNRLPERGRFDTETIHAILDAMPMCHVAYMRDGKPAIVPTLQWREDDRVFWHGSTGAASHLKGQENDVCLNVCIFDGLVLARSAFHHSANYRSVTIFGTPDAVIEHDEKTRLMKNFVEGLYPGRWDRLRPVKEKKSAQPRFCPYQSPKRRPKFARVPRRTKTKTMRTTCGPAYFRSLPGSTNQKRTNSRRQMSQDPVTCSGEVSDSK